MLDSYRKHEDERRALGIPPLPLSPEETAEVCRLLEAPPDGSGPGLLALLRDRVSPGVDPAAKVKAEWLARVASGTSATPVISRPDAVHLLGTMLGGYNVAPLVSFLTDPQLAAEAARALSKTILVYSAFDKVAGTACETKMTTVGSQDTTGPMTADELKELACLEFQCGLFMQSFCHTAAYPKPADVKMHKSLPGFMTERKGVALKPGDGVIHSWLNRLILPDTMGTGGDSHTRFPIGLSLPAGSGLVAFAGALGFMPLDMYESVLVRFRGGLRPGITLRDVVNAIPYFAIKKGLLTVAKKGKKNVFNDRILEMEGLDDLAVDQAYELTDASAERSAAGSVIALKAEAVARFLRSNVALMKKMIESGYKDAETLKRRIEACEAWLAKPTLLERDKNAEYAAVLEIDLNEIREPILACPNDPDDVKTLSAVAGDRIDEVFIGSCMVNIGHFRAAGRIFDKAAYPKTRIWITPPTKMDMIRLMREGYYSIFSQVGARVEIPGCSLCMGNQARVQPGATIISTSTRNFDDRMGDGARVYLGSAELAAVAALKGVLPAAEVYFSVMNEKVLPAAAEIYRYLQFDEMADFALNYA
jgi:aconitate hydratase 2/2-methylisocitrate dehydratase